MKKVNLLAAVAASLTIAFAACNKEKETSKIIEPAGKYTSLNNVFDEVKPQYRKVIVNAEAGGSFYGNSGTRFAFPAYAFQTMDGKTVSGLVDIEMLECTKNSDFILSRMLTESNGEALISAGSFNLKISQGGSALKIAPGKRYVVNFPTNNGAATAGMQFFTGSSTLEVPGSDVSWNLRTDSLASAIVYDGDSISLFPDSTGFVNCDKYTFEEKALVNIKLEGIGADLDRKEILAYYVFDGLLSAIAFNTLYGGSYKSNEFKAVNMVKLKAHIVVCVLYQGNFYSGFLKDVTAADGSSFKVSLVKTTPPEFKKTVDALN